MICGLTVIVKVVVVAHCPADGVKEYVVVVWLFKAGDHVPVIPFVDTNGSSGASLFGHIGSIAANTGVTSSVITISIVTGTAQ